MKIIYMTQCQDEFRILSGRTQKLKVAKWCWKHLNEHNLMYIIILIITIIIIMSSRTYILKL